MGCGTTARTQGALWASLRVIPPAMIALTALIPLSALPAAAAGSDAVTVSPVVELPPDAPPRPVASLTLAPGADPARATTGTVAAASETDLAFTLPGRLAERRVSAGDLVAAGDVLAVLDPEDADAALRGAEANVAAARAQLAQAKDAEDRALTLKDKGVASEVQTEQATRARIGAEAVLEQAEAAAAAAADRRQSTTLTAPEPGIITATLAEPGATLSAGQPVLHLASIDRREVVIDLTEAELIGLTPDARFAVTLTADPQVTATATVGQLDPVAERATRTRRLHLTLADAPEGMRLGAVVSVLPISGAAALPTVPATAVMTENGATSVWVVTRAEDGATGTVARRTITPGMVLPDRISIAEGLNPGDEIVIRGIHSLTDGQTVGIQVSP